jgi:uncharacterized protein with HEPN domain
VKDDRAYLLHIRDAIDAIVSYTTGGRAQFFTDRKTQDAVLRNLEIVGEAVKQLSGALTGAHPDLPWRQIAGMRDKLVHDYFGVDLDLVWQVVDQQLASLGARVDAILHQIGST